VRDVGAGSMHHGSSHPRQHVRANPPKVQDDVLSLVSSAQPSFEGKFNPYAYINWEQKVDAKFDNYDLSE
jgi:hypothetical protein